MGGDGKKHGVRRTALQRGDLLMTSPDADISELACVTGSRTAT
jgi:hypothetical protein